MEPDEIRDRLTRALRALEQADASLFQWNLSERCIASRLAIYLQQLFPDHAVDVEYNRIGREPKRLQLPPECANFINDQGEALVVPDIIVHTRGPDGPNILVLELKKTTNAVPLDCDHLRIHAFKAQLGYAAAALVRCETRQGYAPSAAIIEWI